MFVYPVSLTGYKRGDTTTDLCSRAPLLQYKNTTVGNVHLKVMDDYDDFEVVFGNNSNIAYEKSTSNEIKQRRRSLENELFIDRLLKALGVQKGMFYIRNEFYSRYRPYI